MAELREAHLRYLPAVYAPERIRPDAGVPAAAKVLTRQWKKRRIRHIQLL